MAAAAPSPLASSVEKTNGAKLSRLLIDGGTTVLRNLFDRYHPPAQLVTNLNRHSGTLNDLLRDKVLRKPQWDKLFVNPDSRNFDITLLFLLLTNICGLRSPVGGWHRMPHRRDNSREANIARIKFYRNELYGHVTTTGVDTPTFCTLWREISAALRGLGLNQAEIDRLKAERCGEEHYIDVLLKWADSEEDIKSQLKYVRQSQNEVQQTVDQVRKTQLEYREILQDNKVKLEELHQVQAKTQQTVDELRKTQLEDHEILQESKGRLGESHQFQTITQQTIDKVRQSQLEDRETIQEVYQIDRETHQFVTNVRQTQIDDSRAIQQMCQNTEQGAAKLHEVHMTLRDTKSKVEEISQSHEELLRTQGGHFETLQQQFKQTVENLEGQREIRSQEEILKKLAIIDTQKIMKHHAERYVEGTRVSIFAKVESWLNDRRSTNRVMVISGNPGMGKSVISAVTCQRMLEAERLAGSHFCQHGRARHRNPKVMLQSLARHLADSLPDYKTALAEKLSGNLGVDINDMELKDLFELLFEEPLTSLNNDPGLTYLMVIDGVDESEYQGRNELLDVIGNYFQTLPLWIRFLVTTRPERNIAENLKDLRPLQLEPNSEENLKDIHLCFKKRLSNVLQSEYEEVILQGLVQKSEGVMLYAHYLVDYIKENVSLLTPELLDKTLPSGILSVYQSYFGRLETELRKELKVPEDQFMNFLSAVAAAREPLPLGFVSRLLVSGTSPSAVQPRKVVQAIDCVSALLPVQDGRIHFFHKSVKDWLIDASSYGQHHFSVDEKEGHLVLSKLCIEELVDLKRKGVDGAHFLETIKYALQHGVQHILEVEESRKPCRFEEVVQRYVLDLELLFAKLLVNTTAAFTDILCALEKEVVEASEKIHGTLSSLLSLLRKHVNTLKELPSAIFQTVLNEGGPELSSEAFHILETKYPEIPYMECLDRNIEGRVQTKFHGSDDVTCFDVSPQLDYMVCECRDNMIHLWSLRTGEHFWERRNEVLKNYYTDYSIKEPFKRSVVFHPNKNLVLSGVLSHAYTYDGERKPLFPESECRFSVCSISSDKTRMLTDCPDTSKLIMWSLTDGSEILHFPWNEDILSFAWSGNGLLLAISSFPSGSICLVNMMGDDSFKTIGRVTVSKTCGMIKFSPDCRFLFGLHFEGCHSYELFCLQVKMESQPPLDIFPGNVSLKPWEFESHSETGFLLGDPFCCPLEGRFMTPAFAFVLNTQSVLMVSLRAKVIEMLHRDEVRKDALSTDEYSNIVVEKAAFSLDGDTLYVITTTSSIPKARTLRGWDISSGKFKANKGSDIHVNGGFSNLLTVRGGVLCSTDSGALELWNFGLSECIRSWSNLGFISRLIPISEEQVACELRNNGEWLQQVIILDTTSLGIVSTIKNWLEDEFVACNSKCEVLTKSKLSQAYEIYCQEHEGGHGTLPKLLAPCLNCHPYSPNDHYCVIAGRTKIDLYPEDLGYGYRWGTVQFYVLEAVSEKILHVLPTHYDREFRLNEPECKFVSDEECVISAGDVSRGFSIQLFNVKSGDLLSEIVMGSNVRSLAACPFKHLLAIVLEDSKHSLEVVKIKMPRDKENRKNKRIKLQE